MILYHFRQHLAAELTSFPAVPDATFESYAVTTAALARKILQYVNADDLLLPNGLNSDDGHYNLMTVLNRIIHFRLLGQDAISFEYPGKPDLVTLFSDNKWQRKKHLYIRLSDYRDIIYRLATDDKFVGKYLLRRTMSKLSELTKRDKPQTPQDETYQSIVRDDIYGLMFNTWGICMKLWRSGKVKVPSCDVECYEDLYESSGRKHQRLSTCQDLVDEYGKSWLWAWFKPRSVEIEGVDTYCMRIEEVKAKKSGNSQGLLIPFNTFIQILRAVRQELDCAASDLPEASV